MKKAEPQPVILTCVWLTVALLLIGPVGSRVGAQTTRPQLFQSTGNPIIGDGSYYSADGAMLSFGGKLYVYFGNDQADRWVGGFVMAEYGVMATDDPESGEWELHRNNLNPDEVFDWATGRNAFAGQVAHGADGRFYWYVPVEWKNDQVPDRMAIGVAVSGSPIGPWTDPIGKPLLAWPDVFGESRHGNSLIDPHVFQDTDGQVYLYWGSWWVVSVIKLAPSMTETVGENVRLSGVDGFFEAPWVFRRGDTYYMLYDWKVGGTKWTPSNYQAAIGYATASSPMGPWKYQGIILSGSSATTVHPSMIEHNGQWWATYHTKDAKGGGHFRRSISIDRVSWDEDRILPVKQTWKEPPALRLTRNLAGDAQASASHTEQPPMTLRALNDGQPQTATLPPDWWGNYRSNENKVESDWVRYDWPTPVRVNGVGLQFRQDTNWIRMPARWTLEYLDGEGRWQPVSVERYPTDVDQWLELSFSPVTTKAVRATFWGKPNGALFHSVSLTELEVYGERAEKLPQVSVKTMPGQLPELPATIDLSFGQAGVMPVPVVWQDIPAIQYQTTGRFTVTGRAIGQAAEYVKATITVER
ncbi:MAG: family 43 glycosylhydrolase [Pirellulaceae bacterium]